jgi:hypothetical protein
MDNINVDKKILNEILGGFRIQGTTLSDWCKENGLLKQSAYKAIHGKWNGKKGLEWKKRIIEAANKREE